MNHIFKGAMIVLAAGLTSMNTFANGVLVYQANDNGSQGVTAEFTADSNGDAAVRVRITTRNYGDVIGGESAHTRSRLYRLDALRNVGKDLVLSLNGETPVVCAEDRSFDVILQRFTRVVATGDCELRVERFDVTNRHGDLITAVRVVLDRTQD